MSAEAGLRRGVFALALCMCLGTAAELALLEHTGSWVQWLPFVLCGLGAVAAVVGLRGAPTGVRVARWIAGVMVAGGAFGVWEHLEHNAAFAAEIRPTATWSALVLPSLMGASPLLAPGALGAAGLALGLACWRHPATRSD